MKAYRRKIDSLGEKDVLVIFTPSLRPEHEKLDRDLNESMREGRVGDAVDLLKGNKWLGLLKRAEKKLGERCFTFSNPLFLPPFPPKVLHRPRMSDVDEKLGSRGFNVTAETPCEVWGTSLSSMDTSCVVNTAETVMDYFRLKKFPKIPVEATNKFGISDGELEKLAGDLQSRLPISRGALRREKT